MGSIKLFAYAGRKSNLLPWPRNILVEKLLYTRCEAVQAAGFPKSSPPASADILPGKGICASFRLSFFEIDVGRPKPLARLLRFEIG